MLLSLLDRVLSHILSFVNRSVAIVHHFSIQCDVFSHQLESAPTVLQQPHKNDDNFSYQSESSIHLLYWLIKVRLLLDYSLVLKYSSLLELHDVLSRQNAVFQGKCPPATTA